MISGAMDSIVVKRGFDFARKRKKWVLLLAAFGVSGYGAYKIYHLPSVTRKRRRFVKLVGALVSLAEAVSESSQTVSIVSKDLNEFLKSESDQIPNSLKQISKIAKSGEFSESIVSVTRSLTMGVLHGYGQSDYANCGDPGLVDKVLDKVFTPAGSGFASVVVGSFARSLVMSFFSDKTSNGGSKVDRLRGDDHTGTDANPLPAWANVLFDEKTKALIGDCVQLFVSTAVAVYLDKTMDLNMYDDIFSGMTKPKHEIKVREMLVSVCKNTVETLVRTSHQVLTSPNGKTKSKTSGPPHLTIEEMQPGGKDGFEYSAKLKGRGYGRDPCYGDKHNGWATKVSSALAVPSNRRLVLDLTGRMTFETVRSVMDFLMEKLSDGMVKSVNNVQETVVDSGREAVQYIAAKSSIITTVALSLCLHVMESAWILAPP